ncbi:MAG TPA: biotin/lipoyl-containing protein [Myxococcota bacterium]|nr:biotin/lipoyl-containing protein [Myxococcota bacterium]
MRRVRMNDAEHEIEVLEYTPGREGEPARLRARIDGETIEAGVRAPVPDRLHLTFAGGTALVRLARVGHDFWAFCAGSQALIEPLAGGPATARPPGDVTPPMPAVVVRILSEPGQHVERGQALVVVSAMKMETTLVAPRDGVVLAVNVAEGDKVSPGQVLVELVPEEDCDGEG